MPLFGDIMKPTWVFAWRLAAGLLTATMTLVGFAVVSAEPASASPLL
jgi:hypothetical protein